MEVWSRGTLQTRTQTSRSTLISESNSLAALANWCAGDFLVSSLAILPGLGVPSGRSIYYEQLPPIPRYLLTFMITIATSMVIETHMTSLYSILTLFAVGFLGHSPTLWPPLFDNPWISTSLHEFWGKRWHQLLRRHFLVAGGIPGEWIAGRMGLIVGTFLASGLFHEVAVYLVNRGVDYWIVFFFFIQVVGFVMERLFRKITGRRVGGPLGWLWVFCFLIGTGHIFGTFSVLHFLCHNPVLNIYIVDSWLSRGLLSLIERRLPKTLSPWRRLVFPLLHKQIDKIMSILS